MSTLAVLLVPLALFGEVLIVKWFSYWAAIPVAVAIAAAILWYVIKVQAPEKNDPTIAWHASRYVAAHLLYYPLNLFNQANYYRRGLLVICFVLMPFAALGGYRFVEYRKTAGPVNQLVLEAAEFLNSERLEPPSYHDARRLIDRFNALPLSRHMYPSLIGFMKALSAFYPEQPSPGTGQSPESIDEGECYS